MRTFLTGTLIYFLASFVLFSNALASSAAVAKDWPKEFMTGIEAWGKILSQVVNPRGGVDYVKLATDHSEDLERFINLYEAIDPRSWSDASKTAAYINLYNAGMIANVMRHARDKNIGFGTKAFQELEVNKIRVPGGNIWNGSYQFKVHEQTLHLDGIEHGLVRGQAGADLDAYKVKVLDPRIHSAVNCAAYSCPRLRQQPYLPETLDAMLDENMRQWLNSEEQFSRMSASRMRANSIVMWYYEDFDDVARERYKLGGAGDYLAQYIDDHTADAQWKREHLRQNFNGRRKLALRFSSSFSFDYDWRLADRSNLQ